ncbi:ABC transporter ATP-binding protein [Magnetofaba australis]|uniref:Putative ABC transporter n=1 Tax=Magnetofaba australis IT-1 TaxID=1434232 RepID=A0A1Y2K912_9PROT|nr:ATP-binding cassette domain-containing protein [Magnetofaba australis]OSM06987.1 putative ABC transporter [Magnetofaba australis IT-1]
MSWGFQIERPASVGWGSAFNLEVGGLELDANAVNRRLPVLGRSGSGKSTLMYLLTFMKRPREGSVRWTFPDGHRAQWSRKGLSGRNSTLNLTDLRRRYFGFAYQRSTLSPYLTVAENLMYPLRIRGEHSGEQMREKVWEAVNKSLMYGQGGQTAGGDNTLKAFMKRFPNELSGGQLQRVALMQAMIHDPVVLFADEPTGNLDAATRREVMGVVEQWLAEGERMVIWVTHHLSDAQDPNVTHRVVVSHGRCHLQQNDGAQLNARTVLDG